MTLPGKRAQADKAREMIMHGVGKVLGYWMEDGNGNPFVDWQAAVQPGAAAPETLTPEEKEEFHAILQREADRVARLFGYEGAWTL